MSVRITCTCNFFLKPVLIQGLEAMESKLLQEMKIMNRALDKELRTLTGDHYVEAGGFKFNTKMGAIGGNMCETMVLISVGTEFPAGKVVHQRIKNPVLAKKIELMYHSLPIIVPGLHEEAAADLMATVSLQLKAPNSTVVKLCLDVPMMQRSKQYYLNKIQEFLQHCKHRVGNICMHKPT